MVRRRNRRVLFVCTGNICRSPMAEYLLRHRLVELAVRDVIVESAGVIAMNGAAACPLATAITAEAGLDMKPHSARTLNREMLQHADKILVMEKRHLRLAYAMAPEAASKMALFSSYIKGRENLDIPDPYGRTKAEYQQALALIGDGVEALAAELASEKPGERLLS